DTRSGEYLLIVATHRLSAFDVVLPDPLPGKGEILCHISNFWFQKTEHLMPNHLNGINVANVLPRGINKTLYTQRAVVTK
ncbi:phosphoribosylaminoimidazolesuccinocarboxamide synthase, partial [Xylella fastidiosa subsp. multiplex]|uniref:phosphoribosylaminoimidazolesuccinocarboxamide synthase n=1 Tax=Xylella fastidiosa TaxID=2371 RepID=UPI00132C3E56